MPKFLRTATLVFLPLLTLILGLQVGSRMEQKRLQNVTDQLEYLYSGKTASGQLVNDPEKEVDIGLLWAVWRLLIQHYIEPGDLKIQPMVFGATTGMVKALGDPYTVFMTPSENEDFQSALQGKLEGIGAELTLRNEQVVVVAPLKGSPAAAAGLEPEDVIMEVDGESIVGEALNEVVRRIRGPKGTTVTLTVIRTDEPEPLTIAITRDEIRIPSVEWDVKKTSSGSVGYIALNQFGDQSMPDVQNALNAFQNEDIKGIVLDLRYNGGGYLEGAVELSSFFLGQGKVVTVKRRDDREENHYVYGRPIAADIPLVLLVNEGSASASEIAAGALQHYKRATIIGKKTFGKGTVQEVLELPGGASLRVTTAKWLTPGGKDLSSEGIEPDIVVERTREDMSAERDPQLEAALKLLLKPEGN